MNDQTIAQALEAAKQTAQDAGQKLLPYFGNVEAKSKEGGSISGALTELDGQTETFLHDRLGQFAQDLGVKIGFRGEEQGTQEKADMTWLVDPIDGTAHFIRGLPTCMVMIALIDKDQVLLSVIHDIANQTTYWASRGKGAYCNSERLAVSSRGLNQSLIDFEAPLDKPEYMEKYLKLRKQTGVIGGFASGYIFAMVASGKLDGKIALDPYGKDWDFAPGSLLVQEAGVVVRNIGRPDYVYLNHNFIISNPVVYRELTEGPDAIFPNK